jgi:Site-specific DNA methylase
MLTLGSLFDGSGGFPLAAILEEIKPLWSSEIEPFPIRVTKKRLPSVKHYGDILDMKGSEVEPVDIITFGSPCQDMSIAGNRDGLDGERSNLFFEAIRIIKEMRTATNGKYPRYIIWENVLGAFSSSDGEDFRQVLEQITRVKDETTSIPKPTGGGVATIRRYFGK